MTDERDITENPADYTEEAIDAFYTEMDGPRRGFPWGLAIVLSTLMVLAGVIWLL